MKILISKLRNIDGEWQLDAEGPVALLELKAEPDWTFYDSEYEKRLRKLFEEPIFYDDRGALKTPEPYSLEAFEHLFQFDLPAIGLGVTQVE